MSTDLLGDREAAEGALEHALVALTDAARDLHLFHSRTTFADCAKEACVRLRGQLVALDTYCRPSCGYARTGHCGAEEGAGWSCGCPCAHAPEGLALQE